MDDKNFNSLIDSFKDILNHPEDDMDYIKPLTKSLDSLTRNRVIEAYGALYSNETNSKKRISYTFNNWKLLYVSKPPTIEEFLTKEWLGPVADSIYPYIKEDLYNFWNVGKPYRNAIYYSCIGYGKSFLSTLNALYAAIHLFLMRNPKKYFGLNPATVLAILFVSYSLEKVTELIVEPFTLILNNGPKFRRARTLDQMENWQKADGSRSIVWTTAGDTNVITMGDVNIKVASDPARLLGLTIVLGVLTELTFFKIKGYGDDYIMRLYNDMKLRINSRLHGDYFGRSILDSSPNDMDSALDKYIVKEAPKDPSNYIIRAAKWECQPWHFNNLDDTFPVFKGSSTRSPKIITPEEVLKFEDNEVINVPTEIKQLFIDDLPKSMKDYAGVPAGGDDKLIHNKERIEEMFIDSLPNIYDYIVAPAVNPPEDLIWSQIKDKFFIKFNKLYQFHRAPNAKRFLSVDQSISGDLTGISMCHVEMNTAGELIFVLDFTIAIAAMKGRINLEAIKFFIHDLRRHGRVPIEYVSFDRFQSESTVQYLKRADFNVEYLSVDTSTQPYLNFISYMIQGRVKAGRNIILKNNLKSLIMGETPRAKKKKVDHLIGDTSVDRSNGNWEIGTLGFFAKDLSDSSSACVELANKYAPKVAQYIWDDRKNIIKRETIKDSISEKYGLSVMEAS